VAHQQNARRGSEGESGASLSAAGATIAAIATAPGRAGIGVVRLSGRDVRRIASDLLGGIPAARHATLADFREANGELIDQGIALFFPSPASYTGEDVLELQGHGGPMVMRLLLRRCMELGARLAEPGEFTRRAFLNDRLDLAQAESVADLIEASSVEAARGAARSIAGEFSRQVEAIAAAVLELRMHVEACIDFPEEEIDPADRAEQTSRLDAIRASLARLLSDAEQGAVLRDGLTVALIGPPNVGKSSLLNRLSGEDVAIVTPIAGTTRDYVRSTVNLEGVPIHLVDTAGLRETSDEVERIGIERTWKAAAEAGAALFITERGGHHEEQARLLAKLPESLLVAVLVNKIDISGEPARIEAGARGPTIHLSAKTGEGIEHLRRWLLETAGWKPHGEGIFLARERHLAALREASERLQTASGGSAFELVAEELRLAHVALGAIAGAVHADDVLGAIFSRFCIGK
jgi:tRNA modification GTPase